MDNNLLFVHNANFDAEAANRDQVAYMTAALHKLNRSKVALLTSGSSKETIKERYLLPSLFSLELVKPLNWYTLRTFLLFRSFLKIRKEYHLIYTRDLLFAFLVKTFFPRKKVIYELHELIEKVSWDLLFRATLRKLNTLVTISNGLRDAVVRLNTRNTPIVTLPDGVDIDLFHVEKPQREIKEILDLPLDKHIILYIGGLKEWKGFHTFLEASKHTISENLQFVLVGGKKKNVETLSKEYPNIVFRERVKNALVPYYQKAADLLIVPNSAKETISRVYTSPLKLFEYMGSEKPIIASDLPSIREIVSEREVLFVVPDDPIDLAHKIDTLISNISLMQSLSKTSFEKVQQYTWLRRAEAIYDLFEKTYKVPMRSKK